MAAPLLRPLKKIVFRVTLMKNSFNPKNKGKQNGDSENDGSINFIYFKHNLTTNVFYVYYFISVVKKSKEQKVEEARKLFLLWKLIITDLKV